MPSKRPASIEKRIYVEIDADTLRETGELRAISDPIIAPTITKNVPKGKFEIVYTSELFNVLEKLGNKKVEVLNYILGHKDAYNCLNTTTTELARKIGVSRPTVSKTLKVLSEAQLIKRQGTVIMLSANLMVKGNRNREAYLMQKFIEMDEQSEKYEAIKAEAVDAIIDPQLTFSPDGSIVETAR